MEALKGGRGGAGTCIRPRSRFNLKSRLYFRVGYRGAIEDFREEITSCKLCRILGVRPKKGSRAGSNAEVTDAGRWWQ